MARGGGFENLAGGAAEIDFADRFGVRWNGTILGFQ